MAKYGSAVTIVEFDNAAGALNVMTQHVDTINNVSVEAILAESHTFGDAWTEFLAVGVNRVPEVTLAGWYDDAATTGPDVIFNAPGNTTTRTLKFTWGGSKTSSVETVIKSYRRIATRNELTRYEVVLQPTGTLTEV